MRHITRILSTSGMGREFSSTLYNFRASLASFKVVCLCLKSLAKISIIRAKHNGTMQHDNNNLNVLAN